MTNFTTAGVSKLLSMRSKGKANREDWSRPNLYIFVELWKYTGIAVQVFNIELWAAETPDIRSVL
jgi:hypothetical protein